MTVTTTINRNDYTASADQTVFAYQFRILANDDILVYKNKVLQTLTTHYTVSGAGDATGGNVTFGTGLTAGDTVLLIRADALTQPTDYTASGPFAAETHETAIDKLLMLLQDLDEKHQRAIKFELASALSDVDAPEGTSATDRAGKVWAWDSAGTAMQLLAATVIDAVSVIAVKGDIVQGNASGAAAKLAIGADGDMPYVATDLLAYDKPWGVCWKKGADIASTAALTTGDDGNYFDVTGTVTITSIVTRGIGSVIRLHFDGALVLTHHATDLILPNGSNITTIAGDEATFVEYATGDWRMVAWAGHALEHTHATAAQGGDLGAIQATDITITGSSAATPDANTLTKDLMIGARCTFNGTGTPAYIEEVNFTGAITDGGTGDYTLTIDRDFANANYSVALANGTYYRRFALKLVGSISVWINDNAGAAYDDANVSVILVGDQ